MTGEARTLNAVLDEIIPEDPARGMPGAGSLDLAPRIAESARSIEALIAAGLSELDRRAREQGAGGFASLPPAARRSALEALGASEPGLAGFLPNVVFHTYQAYYQHPRVLEALGLEPRPPHPKGYATEPNDLRLLEAVRARGPLYREA